MAERGAETGSKRLKWEKPEGEAGKTGESESNAGRGWEKPPVSK